MKKIFISYAHKDEMYKDALEEHLALLKRKGEIETWNDRDINAGTDWKNEINQNLVDSDIILFLVSSSFMASDYCMSIEVKEAIRMHQSLEAKLIPIIVRACDWQESEFSSFQGLPKDAKAVSLWDDIDTAWLNIVEGIKKVLIEFESSKKKI